MFSCKDVSESASDYIDGKLPLIKRMNMRLHLFMCLHCRNFMQQFTSTIKIIGKVKPGDTHAKIIDEQVKRLLAEKHKH